MSSNHNKSLQSAPLVRLGDYIIRSTVNNRDEKYGIELIEGVTNEGVFSAPKGNPMDVDLKPYKIVKNGAFVYNPSRLDLGSIAYRTGGLCIVSHLYIVFYLNDEGKKKINPSWLFMYFRRNEFYREVTFRNFGSQRPEFNFNDMSDIMIPLPDIEAQNKYVAIYNAMVANQQSYERGLEDLKLVLDAVLERYKRNTPRMPLCKITNEIDLRNSNMEVSEVDGVNKDKKFMLAVASGEDLSKYKIVKKNQFACNLMHVGRDVAVPIALHTGESPIIVSPAYVVFDINDEKVLPQYALMWFSRVETDRNAWFMCDNNIRGGMEKRRFFEIEIPIPMMPEQKALVELFEAMSLRRIINERLKAQIKDICPILIRGSLEEGK